MSADCDLLFWSHLTKLNNVVPQFIFTPLSISLDPPLQYSTTIWPQYIMPNILSIMLLSFAQKLSLLCLKLCFQNQDYALELTVY